MNLCFLYNAFFITLLILQVLFVIWMIIPASMLLDKETAEAEEDIKNPTMAMALENV